MAEPGTNVPERLNLGLGRARGAIVARMDAHTLYPPDYLARGVERLRRGGADHVSGPQLPQGDETDDDDDQDDKNALNHLSRNQA